MGSIRKSWEPCLPIFAIRHRPPPSFFWQKASTWRRRAGPWSAGPCSFRSGRLFRPVRLRRRRQTKSVMRRPCAGRRESTSFSSVPTLTRAICITIFISIPRPLTAPESFTTSSARPLLCGGSLTGYVLSMIYRLFKIRNSTARAVFSTMASGSWENHPLRNSGCGWQ